MQMMSDVLEDKLGGGAPHSKQSLRLWLRLLTCTSVMEREIRDKLRTEFDTTLPRFDLLSALDRAPEGLTMGQISERLMVSNGNVTGLANRLEQDDFIVRQVTKPDRRTQCVKLTPYGRKEFQKWASAHEGWVDEMMGLLNASEIETLLELLHKTKISMGQARGKGRSK